MVSTFKGIVVGLVLLILVIILCQTVLPTYTTGTDLEFLEVLIPLAVGFGVVIYTIAGMFKGQD